MKPLQRAVAAHPLEKSPYTAIKFSCVGPHGTPLYRVGKSIEDLGAPEALRKAFEKFGGHCFHCKKWMPAQPLSHDCTRDHLRPRRDGGKNYLHNLVLACGPCNREKGGENVIGFRSEVGAEYLKALDEHIVRCLKKLDSN